MAESAGGAGVRRIVCGYRDGELPGRWLQVYRRLSGTLDRARLPVRAGLAPLGAVPPDAGILIVPADLAAEAAALAGRAEVVG